MRIKLFSLIGLSFLLIAGFIYYSRSSNEADVMTVGMMSGWAPFMTINQRGEFEGFDVDVATELATRLGKKCEIVDMGALASLFVALDTNKIEMVLSGLDITQERLNKINMTSYCGDKTQEYSLLFWNEIPINIKRIEDLENYPNPVVVVEPGVSAEKYLASFDYISKKHIASLADRVLDLQYGKSLAMLLEPAIAQQLMAKKPQLKSLSVPLPPEFQIYGMGIATKKENLGLSAKVEAAIADMKSDGTLKKLEIKWQLQGAGDEA